MNWLKKNCIYILIVFVGIFLCSNYCFAIDFKFKIDPNLYNGYVNRPPAPCGNTVDIFNYLKDSHKENILTVKTLREVVVTLFHNPENETWTILISDTLGGTCVVMHDDKYLLYERG